MTGPVDKGLKLLHLYRRGVGGERHNAGRLLLAHLKAHDLTLYDLDSSLPVSQDLAALDAWRESAALVAKLGTPRQDEVLTRLVDAGDLTDGELARLLDVVDLQRLAEVRADGWAYAHDADPALYRRAAQAVTAPAVRQEQGSLAERLRAATERQYFLLTHPERHLRADGPIAQRALLGILLGLTGREAQLTDTGVRAHLNAHQLARARALMAQHLQELTEDALRYAEQQGRQLGQKA